MRLIDVEYQDAWCERVEIALSRRNLESLLAKLDGNPPNSACTITKECEGPFTLSGTTLLVVKAEENNVQYAENPPGRMHDDTERAISCQKGPDGVCTGN